MIELARQTQDSYQSLCDRFRAATGWSLRFIRLQSQTADEIETELVERGEYSLWQRVDDGRKCIGLLVVDLPDVATPFGSEPTSGSYDSVLGLTESIASLMSRQAQAERALLEKRQTSTTVSHVGCSLRPGMGLGENVRELLAAAVRLSGYQSASFYTLNPSTDRLKLRFVHGIQAHNLPMGQRELASSWLDLEALSRGYSFIERKSQSDDQWLPRDAKSGLAFGVQSDLIPLGTLWIYDSRPRSFPDHELKLLQDVANQLALALERERIPASRSNRTAAGFGTTQPSLATCLAVQLRNGRDLPLRKPPRNQWRLVRTLVTLWHNYCHCGRRCLRKQHSSRARGECG
jgi:GAF domain-containing protein